MLYVWTWDEVILEGRGGKKYWKSTHGDGSMGVLVVRKSLLGRVFDDIKNSSVL